MAVACFHVTFREDRSEHSSGYDQKDEYQGRAIVPLPAGVSKDKGTVVVFQVVEKLEFDPVMSIFPLRLSTKVVWYESIALGSLFYGINFSTCKVYALQARRYAKRHRNGSEPIVDGPGWALH